MSVNSYHVKEKHKKKIGQKRDLLDYLIYFAVIFGPLMTIPQVYDIWVLSKKDISVISRIAYLITALIWLVYGLKKKDRPIIMVQFLWIVLESAIIIGAYS